MSSSDLNLPKDEVIIHVLVVGFHHKKGCVVEFAYPAVQDCSDLTPGDLPEPWKHLPTLALPDGAHNYEEDTIYFHLPSLENASETVYGISCYRQMSAQQLLRRSSDITRETVQKSVCVLSRLPLFGLIQAKLELITHAYFDERDFSKVSLLEETYRNLNSSLPKEILDGQQAYLGLSVRDFVLRFKHKALLLFKLLLLERKVLFYKAPVKDLCSAVLTLCSLVPGLVETGLTEAATSVLSRLSPDLLNNICDGDTSLADNNNTIGASTSENVPVLNAEQPPGDFNLNNNSPINSIAKDLDVVPSIDFNDKCSASNQSFTCDSKFGDKLSHNSSHTDNDNDLSVAVPSKTISEDVPSSDAQRMTFPSSCNHSKIEDSRCLSEPDVSRFIGYINLSDDCSSNSLPLTVDGTSFDKHDDSCDEHCYESMDGLIQMNPFDLHDVDIEASECGFPLLIFTKGMLCHPYLSLPFLDLLADVNIRGFIIGATNILFKQKKHLFDVIIEVDEGKIEILDPDLRRYLSLTTEDLRFADHLLRHVIDDKKDVFLDGTGWEGGDEWLRSQFKLYLLSVMRTSLLEGPAVKEFEAFNASFVNSWKLTHNYRMWHKENHTKLLKFAPGHLFQGQLSMADMKLKFSHSMQSEKGRRINSAVANTGKAVYQTGKAVGGAFSSAKSAVSSWWTTLNAQQEKKEDKTDESEEKNKAAEQPI